MNSIHEAVVHFDNFKNIDLCRQGLYYVRVSIYTKDITDPKLIKKKFALPYLNFSGDRSQIKEEVDDNELLCKNLPSRIDDSSSSFCSHVFRVQYSAQEEIMNEGCVFRLELQAHRVTNPKITKTNCGDLRSDRWILKQDIF
eukprot:142457_1